MENGVEERDAARQQVSSKKRSGMRQAKAEWKSTKPKVSNVIREGEETYYLNVAASLRTTFWEKRTLRETYGGLCNLKVMR